MEDGRAAAAWRLLAPLKVREFHRDLSASLFRDSSYSQYIDAPRCEAPSPPALGLLARLNDK